MEKYKDNFHKRVKPKMNHSTGEYRIEPFKDAQVASGRAQFAEREREQFFNEACGEILADSFVAWLKTEAHAQKEREFIYHSAMALGSIKEKLIGIERYGANMKFVKAQENEQESSGDA